MENPYEILKKTYGEYDLNPGGVKYPLMCKEEFEKEKQEIKKQLIENQKSQKVFQEEIRSRFKRMEERISQPPHLPFYIYTTKGFLKLNKYIVYKGGVHYLLGEGKVGTDTTLWEKIHECYQKKKWGEVYVTWGDGRKTYIDDIMLVKGDPLELINKLKTLQNLKEESEMGEMGLIHPRVILHKNGQHYKLHFDQELPEGSVIVNEYEGENLFYLGRPLEGVML